MQMLGLIFSVSQGGWSFEQPFFERLYGHQRCWFA
jgi:hypothetical protein